VWRGDAMANVVYQFRRGANGLPCIVRTQKSPGTEAPGLSLTSTPGATPEEEALVIPDNSISCQPRPFAKSLRFQYKRHALWGTEWHDNRQAIFKGS
jgi:hypothetical protein